MPLNKEQSKIIILTTSIQQSNKQGKEIKGIKTEKKVVCIHREHGCIENSKESTKISLKLISVFNKITEYKVNFKNSFCTPTMNNWNF